MKKSLIKNILVLLLVSLVLTANPVIAASDAGIGRQQAVNIAQGVFPGRVLSVKPVQLENGDAWRIKTLSASGDVHIVTVDAHSGRVLSRQ